MPISKSSSLLSTATASSSMYSIATILCIDDHIHDTERRAVLLADTIHLLGVKGGAALQ